MFKISHLEVFYKESALKIFCAKFAGKHLYRNIFFNCNFFEKETPTQVFYSKFFEIFRTPVFKTPPVAPTECSHLFLYLAVSAAVFAMNTGKN